MPTAKPLKDAPEPTPQMEEPDTPAAEPDIKPPATATTGPEPGVYEFTHFADCVYPHVPLSCRAAYAGRPADAEDPNDRGEQPVTATVFDWPFGPPDDGRWTKTRKKPNQAADNAPAPSSEE